MALDCRHISSVEDGQAHTRQTPHHDAGVDLLRILSMLGICMIHTIGFSGDHQRWLSNICQGAVVLFMFISGWYGIKLRGGGDLCASL